MKVARIIALRLVGRRMIDLFREVESHDFITKHIRCFMYGRAFNVANQLPLGKHALIWGTHFANAQERKKKRSALDIAVRRTNDECGERYIHWMWGSETKVPCPC